MARGRAGATLVSVAKPASGATGARVRRSRSKAANETTRALRASVGALAGKVALRAADQREATGPALRYLEVSRPTSVLAAAPLNAEDKAKVAYVQADQMVSVIRAVLEGLELSDADYTRGIDLAIKELRAASRDGWEPL